MKEKRMGGVKGNYEESNLRSDTLSKSDSQTVLEEVSSALLAVRDCTCAPGGEAER